MACAKKQFWSYQQSQEWAILNQITSKRKLYQYTAKNGRPAGFPARPDTFYSEWISWGDFLQTYTISSHDYTSYEECKKFAQTLNMKSKNDWSEFVKSGKKPKNIPSEPRLSYLNKGWKSWSDFLGYKRSHSYGEVVISRILNNSDIRHLHQVSFCNCRHKLILRFDFGIMKDKEIIALIEFHGKQHYEAVTHWGGDKYLNEIQERDLIKEQYCIDNHMPLLIIKYKNLLNIHEILQDFFTKHTLDLKISSHDFDIPNKLAYCEFPNFEECRRLAHSLNLKSGKQWRLWCDKNKHIKMPRYPDAHYAKLGWIGWIDFLNKNQA
jgi:hypothetical protein